MEGRTMSETLISNQQILKEIRAERQELEKLQTALGQPRREGALCGAKTSGGSPCRRYPPEGGTRCVLHGGASPLARQEAERRMLLGASFALDRLLDAVAEHNHPPCEHCGCTPGRADPTVLRAALGLLDRSGFSPGVRLLHSTDDEERIGEIRVNIVNVSAEQRAQNEDSDREVEAMRRAERQANSVESHEPERDNSLVFDLGVSE